MRLNTRPAGLIEPAQPVVIADPYSQTAQRAEEAQRRARAAERQPALIEYEPAATARALADYRLSIEMQREAQNRGLRPSAARGPL